MDSGKFKIDHELIKQITEPKIESIKNNQKIQELMDDFKKIEQEDKNRSGEEKQIKLDENFSTENFKGWNYWNEKGTYIGPMEFIKLDENQQVFFNNIHPFEEVLYVETGSMKGVIELTDGKKINFELKSGELVIFPTNTWHVSVPTSKNTKAYLIGGKEIDGKEYNTENIEANFKKNLFLNF